MITANESRKLSREWNCMEDTWQLKKYEKQIKRECKKGKRELVSTISPRPRVVEKLKAEGYEVVIGVIGIVIRW